jgi:hypothetical protein
MRWSSTLTLIVIEFLAISLPVIHALPLPEDFNELYVRNPGGNDKGKGKAKDLKESSKNYRDNARQSSTSFDTGAGGGLVPVHHQAPHTPQKGQDADHAHEAQTAHHALGNIGHTFGGLATPVRQDLKNTFNHPDNMIFVDKSTNRSKGQLTKQAIDHRLPQTPARADHQAYLPTAHGVASQTAHNMDNVLKQHGVQGAHDSPFRKAEEKVQSNMHMGQPSTQHPPAQPHTPPHGSAHSSPHSSPHGSP